MKKRHIKKLIIDKANHVVIPDVTQQIKQRFDEIPPKQERRSMFKKRRLVEVMAFSMALLIVATLSILYASRDTDPFAATANDDSLHEVVMLSSISTVSVIDQTTTDVSSNTHMTSLSNGQHNGSDDETEITNNIEGIRRYLKLMENVLTSDATYRYQRRVINRRQQKYALTFETNSLADETTDYELQYDVYEEDNDMIMLHATITKDNETYSSEMTYQKQTKAITMKTAMENDQSIEIAVQRDDGETQYHITHYDGTDIIEQVSLNYQSRTAITLTFEHGAAYGTYAFSLTTGPLGLTKMLNIDYDLQNQYQGNIKIALINAQTYRMVITPNGRQSFVVERSRGNGQNN